MEIDWEADSEELIAAVEDAPRCRGGLHFQRNRGALPRNGDYAQQVLEVGYSEDVFANIPEFCTHHGRKS